MVFSSNSTIPVRGRLHSTIVLKVHFELHCNLSPQGDENSMGFVMFADFAVPSP